MLTSATKLTGGGADGSLAVEGIDVEGHDAEGIDVLGEARALVVPALTAALRGLPDGIGHVVEYHLGTSPRDGAPAGGYGGTALRPALVLLACEALGGDPARAVPAAVAVELVHNASLIHDDVIDAGRTRRGRPAAWTVYGASTAVLAGDALFFLALQILAETPWLADAGVGIVTTEVRRLVEGEHARVLSRPRDTAPTPDTVPTPDTAALRTGSLFAGSCELGAVAAAGTAEQVAALRAFGTHLAAALRQADRHLDQALAALDAVAVTTSAAARLTALARLVSGNGVRP
ncbi:polyprenyl synthetase family protein [Actinomadura fibrosa]|uniref:Polyprenyl synthetase family protein n=1 Tax=Actinomadura fibrosa TaxID=111802 RepID=A0ABW2XEB1_9ACTN|nr:polyprenyl synthetase family protein [Actinomadura fibrosa]